MVGGILQFIHRGPQDIYLTNNPEVTFFKSVFKRHTNFACESVEEFFGQTPSFGKKVKCKLSKKYDLISGLTLLVSLPSLNDCDVNILDLQQQHYDQNTCNCVCKNCLTEKCKNQKIFGWTNSIGHALIEHYTIEINGIEIDKQYGEWLEIWSELALTNEKKALYNEMIGRVDAPNFTVNTHSDKLDLMIPLNFWFCRHIGLALPVISLYNSDIEIGIKFRSFDGCWVTNTRNVQPIISETLDASLLIDYILLDFDERHIFYSETQTYLIEQVFETKQVYVSGINSVQVDIKIQHAVKELIFVFQRDDVVLCPTILNIPILGSYPIGNDWFNYTPNISRKIAHVKNNFEHATLLINGEERFQKRKASYFKLYQPYLYHTRNSLNNNIYVYSFSLKPEELQASGHFNFFGFLNVQLNVVFGKLNRKSSIAYINELLNQPLTNTAKIYAPYYNIFQVQDGVGAILFS